MHDEAGSSPHSERVAFCYRYYEHVSNVLGKSDYTDGMYFGVRSLPYDEAQQNQVEHLLDEARVERGMTILDVGCGRGRLLQAAEARGAHAVGITISREQVHYCRGRGLDVHLLDYRRIGETWPGRFDAVIANGSIEHFVSVREGLARRASETYRELFGLVHRVISRGSSSRRFVTTAIHHRTRAGERFRMGLRRKLAFSALAELYGGWYPLDGQLERCATSYFDAVRATDGTRDYLWTSEDAFADFWQRLVPKNVDEAVAVARLARSLAQAGVRAPLYVANPWLWTWQFRGEPAPVVLRRHTWEYRE